MQRPLLPVPLHLALRCQIQRRPLHRTACLQTAACALLLLARTTTLRVGVVSADIILFNIVDRKKIVNRAPLGSCLSADRRLHARLRIWQPCLMPHSLDS